MPKVFKLQQLGNAIQQILNAVGGKAEQSDLNAHTDNNDVHVSTTEKNRWNDTYTKNQVDDRIEQGGKVKTVSVNGGSAVQPDEHGNIDIEVPTDLKDLNDDSTHRTVTDAEKSVWSGKQPAGDYATKTELANGLNTKQPTGDYATNTALAEGLATKQGTISDLDAIRSGAGKGATSVQGVKMEGDNAPLSPDGNGVVTIPQPEIPDSVTSVIANNELVFQTSDGQSVKGKVGITTGADGLLHLTLTDEEGHTYSSPIAGLRVNGNALQYSNDGEIWTTVQTFGKLTIKYVQASDPASGDEGDLALVGTTNAYVLKVYIGGSWVSVGDIGSLDLTSDGITMVGENKTLTQKMQEVAVDADFVLKNVEDGGFNNYGRVSNSDWCHNVEFIPVEEGDVIRWRSGNALTELTDRQKNALCFYSADKTFSAWNGYNAKDRVLDPVVEGVAYIRASFRKENGYGIDIKKSGETDFTTVFSVVTQDGKHSGVTKVPELEESLNEFQDQINGAVYVAENVGAGGLDSTTGQPADNNWCHALDLIEVDQGDTITWKAGSNIPSTSEARGVRALLLYNSNREKTSYYGYTVENREITIDAGIKYIQPSFPTGNGYSIEKNGVVVFTTILAGTVVKSDAALEKAQEALERTQETAVEVENLKGSLFDYDTIYSKIGYYNSKSNSNNNLITADPAWGISAKIPCQYNDSIVIGTPSTITNVSSPQRDIYFYDEEGNFLTYNAMWNNRTLNAPENTSYATISVRLADADKFTIKVNDELKYQGAVYDAEGNVFEKMKEVVQEYAPEDASDNKISYIPLYGFERKDVSTNFQTTDSTKVVCTSVMLIPYYGVELHFKMPSTIGCKMQYGIIQSVETNASSLLTKLNGETATFNSNVNIRFAFYKINGDDITLAEIQTLVGEGKVSISYENQTPNVVAKNIGSEVFAKAVMYREARDSSTNDANSYLHNLPVFAHFSDLHGDIVRLKNIMDYCQYLGVDAVINTGDIVCNKAIEGASTYHAVVGAYGFPTLLCVGNHDAWLAGDNTEGTHNEKLYANFIQPNSTKFGYTLPAASDYDNGATYYYRDFTSLNIRVISVNLYEENLAYWAYCGRISKKQIDWLIATLASTPANHGVIIIQHTHAANNSSSATIDRDNNYSDFYDDVRTTAGDQYRMTGNPISKIVDAFISGEEYSGSYTQQLDGGGSETINYTTTGFDNLNSNVEFICYMSGHRHTDFVGYRSGTTNRQLVLNITTAQSLYGFVHYSKANNGDLPRGGKGACEDAFNVYGIDRTAGTVRIARVGSNMTSSLKKREVMVIPYK